MNMLIMWGKIQWYLLIVATRKKSKKKNKEDLWEILLQWNHTNSHISYTVIEQYYIYMWCFHIGGWYRYTRWTGRLSHQTSNLSDPCNLLLKGCDLCFTQYQFQGEKVSDPPSYHQTTKITLTETCAERSGYMHIDKQVTLSILIMLVPREGPTQPK